MTLGMFGFAAMWGDFVVGHRVEACLFCERSKNYEDCVAANGVIGSDANKCWVGDVGLDSRFG